MRTWVVAAQKGGVGKTTTAVNVAGALARRGNRVLMMDLDPNTSLSSYFHVDASQPAHSAYTLFDAAAGNGEVDLTSLVVPTAEEGISIIPGSRALFAVDRRFGSHSGMGTVLRNALPTFENDYDFCVLDCAPTVGTMLVNALACSETLIVPLQTEFLAVESLAALLRTLEMIERRLACDIHYIVVPTMFDRRTRASHESLRSLRASEGIQLWDAYIPVDTKLRDASKLGRPLTCWMPESRASEAYERLLDTLLELRSSPSE